MQIPSEGALGTADLGGNIDNVSHLMAHLLYHEKVFSAQHVDIFFGVGTIRKQHVGWSGKSNADLGSYITGADTMAFNGYGVRNTARVLKIGINTVIRALKTFPKASNLRKGATR